MEICGSLRGLPGALHRPAFVPGTYTSEPTARITKTQSALLHEGSFLIPDKHVKLTSSWPSVLKAALRRV